MAHRFPRRRLLQGLAAAGMARAWPVRAATPPRVAVIGGGMAGVACAWLLDPACEVHLFEARATLGGNVQTLTLALDGGPATVDLGAQYFHPGPYPTYVQLLEALGLWPETTGEALAFDASITLFDAAEPQPRFVSPVLPGRAWPLVAPWNRDGLQAFQTTFNAAARREAANAPWGLAMADWLQRLRLSPAQAGDMILPWAASLNSGDVTQTGALSARALMVFAAGALPESPLDPVRYYVLRRGLAEPLQRMAAQFTQTQVHLGTPVEALAPRGGGGFVVQPAGQPALAVDAVVFAASGPPTAALLAGLPQAVRQRDAVLQVPFYDAAVALHTRPAFAPADPRLWSFLNARIDGTACEASMWMDPVLGTTGLWKSWITHRAAPPATVAQAAFRHVLPAVAAQPALRRLAALQGQDGLWFAGGWLLPFDSQETALRSAMAVADGLAGPTVRSQRLRPPMARGG